MKNQLSLFVSIFLLVGQLQAQTQIPSYVPTTGLVGWWPFNGNSNDESGNGNNGTVNGATLTNDRSGNIGKAYSFNGSTNYITIANSSIAAFGSQSFTCSAWIKTSATAAANNSGMFVRYDNCVSNSGWGLGFTSHKIIGLEFPSSRVSNTVISTNTYNNDSWTQAIFVRDVSQMKDMLYVNGVLLTQTSFSSVNLLSNTGSVLRFGSCAGYQFYNGVLDDIGIWNRALTQQEVNELYTSSDPFDVSATTTTICAGEPTTLSVQSLPGTISSLTCASATNNGTLIAGVAASGVNSVVPYTGGNGGMHNGQTVTSTGVTGLTATLSAGSFANGAGNLTYTITGTPSTNGTASFALNIGGQSCTLSRTVVAGTISALTCTSASNNGTLTAGVAASSVSSVIPYTGGNGGTHNGQTVISTGITGLTATLSSGSFANGAGSLSYIITGTPSTSGTASFALNIGGQTCTLTRTVATLVSQYPTGSVFCTANPTSIVNVTNPTTGRIWMDRNLGATQVATSSTDANAYGDLYQWGRRSDGHQCRNSTTTSTLSSTNTPAHGNFITINSGNYDWLSPQNTNLWQGVNGVNNPCPSGYRLPTDTELEAERASWSANTSVGAFASPLKLPMAGRRSHSVGSLSTVGTRGYYWSSTVSGAGSRGLLFNSSNALMFDDVRAYGFTVRCLKD